MAELPSVCFGDYTPDRPLCIDSHTHTLPRDIPDFMSEFGYGGFIRLHHKEGADKADMIRDDGHFFRAVNANCYSPAARIADMNRDCVDVQILSTVPVMFSYWAKPRDCLKVSEFLNDDIAKQVAYCPERFAAIGSIPMNDPHLACQELTRCVKELGIYGAHIGSHIDCSPTDKKTLDDPSFDILWKTAQDLGACLLVHPWDMMGKEFMKKYWLPWLVGMPAETSLAICSFIFGGIFERFPNMRVAFAHGGGSFMSTLGRIGHGFDVRPDLCAVDNDKPPREYLGKFWLDSCLHDPEMLNLVKGKIGANKVMLGTDYPFPLGELQPGKVIEQANVSQWENAYLRSQSCLDWMGISADRFNGCREKH